MTARLIVGDVREVLRSLPDDSVDLVLSSPPFLALRSYLPADHPDKAREIGSEPSPGEYLDVLLDVVEECARVLAPHGTLAFELGDTYAGGGSSSDRGKDGEGAYGGGPNRVGLDAFDGGFTGRRGHGIGGGGGFPLDKSLCMIPEMFAFALAYGRNPFTGRETPQWRVRNVVAWCRPNPPVGALGDKFRPGTSYLTIACKARDRWFDLDAVRESFTGHSFTEGSERASPDEDTTQRNWSQGLDERRNTHAGAPPLDWWEIPTQPYKGAHYACVDSETEALTPIGWRRHDQLTDGDLIAAYDVGAHVVRWESATFHRYPYDGELVAIDKRETVQRLTPNHRTLIRSRKGVERVVLAEELRPSHRLPVAAPFDLPPAVDDPGPDMATLLGWFVSEGSMPARAKAAFLYQSATASPDDCVEIRRVLDAVGASYRERSRVRTNTLSPREWEEVCWTVLGEHAVWLRSFTKTLPAHVIGWSHASCAALLDALIAGDGHTRVSGRRAFIQKDRDTIDAVQALVTRLGLRSTLSRRGDGQFSLTIGERSWLSLRGTGGKHDEIGRAHYEGVVWCPSVPSTFWLARRDGRPFITGNTWPEKLVVRPIEAMCAREVCTVCGEPRRRIVGEPDYVPSATYRGGNRIREADRVSTAADHVNQFVGDDGSGKASLIRTAPTLGWTDCGHGTFRRGVVLDPFVGSGTTLAVAEGLGRDSIGIDLDERNADLARERCGMFVTVEEHA